MLDIIFFSNHDTSYAYFSVSVFQSKTMTICRRTRYRLN